MISDQFFYAYLMSQIASIISSCVSLSSVTIWSEEYALCKVSLVLKRPQSVRGAGLEALSTLLVQLEFKEILCAEAYVKALNCL
jgi:hypothetical protein